MNWKNAENKRLVEALLLLKNSDEAERFLRDLMTEQEIVEFAKRLKTAEMLLAEIPYSAIEKETGLSSTTVARVSKWLNGPLKGYKNIIAKLNHHHPIQFRRGLS